MTIPDLSDLTPEPHNRADPEPHNRADNTTDVDGHDRGESKKSTATQLVEHLIDNYRLGITNDGEPFAVPLTTGPAHVAVKLRGSKHSLRASIANDYFHQHGKVAPQQALTDALNVAEGLARQQPPERLHLRIAEAGGALWVDLGDVDGHVMKITGGQATVETEAPVLFQRSELTAAFPMPATTGSLDELWPLLNVTDNDRALLTAVLVSAFMAEQPHPVLTLTGEQGTGKSTAARMIVSLIDPSTVPLRKPPRDVDGWVTAAAGSWGVAIDNLSQVQEWLSDAFCRAVTGDGDVRRALYTDGGLAVFQFRRQLILTGIDFAGLRGDLAERLVLIELRRIRNHERRDERELNEAWAAAYPRILRGLFDLVAAVWEQLPGTRLQQAPRMADFARVVHVIDNLTGSNALQRYAGQSSDIAADTLSGSFAQAILATITDFTGTAAELLEAVRPTEADWRAPRDWPKNARNVTSMLKRDAPALRTQGWAVDELPRGGAQKTVRWRLTQPDPTTRDCPKATPVMPATPVSPGNTGQTTRASTRASTGINTGIENNARTNARTNSPGISRQTGVTGITGIKNGQSLDGTKEGTDFRLDAFKKAGGSLNDLDLGEVVNQ